MPSLHHYVERLQENQEELEATIEELSYRADEDETDVIFLFDGVKAIHDLLEEQDLKGYIQAKKMLKELIELEYRAVEERERANAQRY